MSDFAARNIVKEFETPSQKLRISDGVSLGLNRGQNVAIVGESGSGKSTFLHIVGTLDQATSGKVEVLGVDVSGFNEEQLAEHRNTNIGFIFQQHHLLPQLSAIGQCACANAGYGQTRFRNDRSRERLLESVGLADRMSHKPGLLSGGEQQRVAVARALIGNPLCFWQTSLRVRSMPIMPTR